MFTGIIHNLAKVQAKSISGHQVHFRFDLSRKEKLAVGESIAVNGVCLTAKSVYRNGFEADVIRQTLESTTLGELKVGSVVNLERSLRFGDLISGHFVTGHVDARAQLSGVEQCGENKTWIIQFPLPLSDFIKPKGSVALDGVSLTVQKVERNAFMIGLVPHTLTATNFQYKRTGDYLNLEVDILARYQNIQTVLDADWPRLQERPAGKHPRAGKANSITLAHLINHGF